MSNTRKMIYRFSIIAGLLVLAGQNIYNSEVTMYELLLALVLLVVIAVLTIAIILLLANLGAYFTKIAQGTTVFISAGESLKAIWPNVGGYKMSQTDDLDGRHWLIPEKDKKKQIAGLFHDSMSWTQWLQKWLWEKFGVRFIAWFWPHTHVHKFDIRKGGRRRIEARSEVGADEPLRSRVVDSPEPTLVSSLLFLAPRPVYLEGVELAGDNSRVNLLLLPVFRQVIPALPTYYLKGDFFTLLDAAMEAAMVDFFARHRVAVFKKNGEKKGQFAADSYDLPTNNAVAEKKYEEEYEESPLTYAHWLKLTKAGEGTPMEKRLRHLNVSDEYIVKLRDKGKNELADYVVEHLIPKGTAISPSSALAGMIPSGIVPRFGFALVSFRVVEWEAHKSTVALAEALLAKETQLHAAEGVRQKAYGERDATAARGEGESSRFERLMKPLREQGAGGDVAARVVETMLRTENIRDSKVTTYVEGGGTSTSIMVPASSPAPNKGV